MENLSNQLKIVNMLSTYFSTTPITLSTPIAGTILDTTGYKEVLLTLNIRAVGTNATFAVKFQHMASPLGAAATDITNSIVDGKLGTCAFTTLNLSSDATNRNGKMSLRLNDGTLERYIGVHATCTGTFPSGAAISVLALLGAALSSPQAGQTTLAAS